jgi:hypothetical protein
MAITINNGDLRLRPKHCRKFAQFSREWYEACDRAFTRHWVGLMVERIDAYIVYVKREAALTL